ncbi:phosphatases II, partial [Auricularia subglabra TFB-10046 SS5]
PAGPYPWTLQTNEVFPRLYISDVYSATARRTLRDLQITHVISVMPGPVDLPIPAEHLQVQIRDSTTENISSHFDRTIKFIQTALAESSSHRVLIHCYWGMSRSVSMAIAYLQAQENMTFEDALEQVSRYRKLARPNSGFRSQLRAYGEMLTARG